jgi:hypothetical protein
MTVAPNIGFQARQLWSALPEFTRFAEAGGSAHDFGIGDDNVVLHRANIHLMNWEQPIREFRRSHPRRIPRASRPAEH